MTLKFLEPAQETQIATARPRRARADLYIGRKLWDPEPLSREAAPARVRIAQTEELPEVHQLSEAIMETRLAPLWSLASAHGHTKASAWVHEDAAQDDPSSRSPLSGVFLILPLNWDGEAALRAGRFNFATPRLDELCQPGEEIAAIYFWLTAGRHARARRNVMRTALAWTVGSNAGVRFYARAASLDGERALAGLHFRRFAPDSPNFFLLDQRR